MKTRIIIKLLVLTVLITNFACTSQEEGSGSNTISETKKEGEQKDEADAGSRASDGKANGNIRGNWAYTTILYKDGSDYKLRNRMSHLELKADGSYAQVTWVGSSTQGFSGTYTISGNTLTLTPGGGEDEVFEVDLSSDGKTLTLRSRDGGGWILEPK